MHFSTKTLVIALAAGAVAMPSKPKMDGKPPCGNSTKPMPPPAGEKDAEKRDFLGIPFPNITDIFKGIGARGEADEGEKPMLPGLPHSGKNMTLPRGLRATKTTKARRQEEGGDDEEGGAPKKPEGSGAAKPKKPEGSGAPKPPKECGAPKPENPKGSGAPKPEKRQDKEPKNPEGCGKPKKPEEGEDPVAAAGSPPKHAAGEKPPTPPGGNGALAAVGFAPPSPPNGTMPHPKVQGKRTVRGPTSPIHFWA